MFGAKVEIALREKGLPFDLVMVPFDFHALYTPRHPEVLRINPKRQVPVLVAGELELFDSTQIFEYLEDLAPHTPLWPQGVPGRARARQLEHLSDEVYFPHVVRLMGLQERLDSPEARAAINATADFAMTLDAQLARNGRPWLADIYSFADVAFYMAQLFAERQGAPLPAQAHSLLAWRERMSQRAAVRTVAGAMARWLVANGRPLPTFMQPLASA
jgi:glutathione S-transferase